MKLFGNNLRISEFSHGDVNVTPDTKGELCAYYGRSHPQHRFERSTGTPSFAPPSQKLFIASIPLAWTEETLREFLSPAGRILEVKMLPPKKFSSAIVNMESVQEAINVLTMFHWTVVDRDVPSAQGPHDLNLRINFSTSQKQRDDAGHGGYNPHHQGHHQPQQYRHMPPQQQQQQQRGGYAPPQNFGGQFPQQMPFYPQGGHQPQQAPQSYPSGAYQPYRPDAHMAGAGGAPPPPSYHPPQESQRRPQPALMTATFQSGASPQQQQQQQQHYQAQQAQQSSQQAQQQPPPPPSYSQGYGSFLK